MTSKSARIFRQRTGLQPVIPAPRSTVDLDILPTNTTGMTLDNWPPAEIVPFFHGTGGDFVSTQLVPFGVPDEE